MAAVRFWVATIFCLFLSSSCSLPHRSSFFGLERSGRGNGSCSGSWQYLTFDPRPVVFVRIVGVDNTANEVFHCVHFECPANQKEPSICGSDRTDSSEQSVMLGDTTISSIM